MHVPAWDGVSDQSQGAGQPRQCVGIRHGPLRLSHALLGDTVWSAQVQEKPLQSVWNRRLAPPTYLGVLDCVSPAVLERT